ncbi:MAG: restriction endonuclease, partial [Phycisphaerae bacterium]|nr:restriction endonuclease [Phycisphaerae bacterium]
MTGSSKQFEKDVWAFANTLSTSAEVLFDHKVMDKDTGSQRQVDVWINAKLGNHIPISILVSCKNYKRKLDITHIESFIAEVHSTSASTGVIYSSSGFTKPALKKAESHGMACCRLFRNEPTDIPKS